MTQFYGIQFYRTGKKVIRVFPDIKSRNKFCKEHKIYYYSTFIARSNN